MRAVLLVFAIAACGGKAAEPVVEPTCAEALKNSGMAAGIKAENVAPAIRQCELEKWPAALKTCLQTSPAGADLAPCFKKFPKR